MKTQDAGLFSGQLIIIERKNEDGSWPRQARRYLPLLILVVFIFEMKAAVFLRGMHDYISIRMNHTTAQLLCLLCLCQILLCSVHCIAQDRKFDIETCSAHNV